jgi:phenylalanyl-tRNA synthetase beta subunit
MIRVTLQSRERTLTEAEIVDISSRILEPLQYTWGAQLRSS